MKLKKEYYCVIDENNKPDYRKLFESREDAQKWIKKIKNSTKGETALFGKNKKDYFVDGLKKEFINPYKKLHIKRGCWSVLRVKKLVLMDNFQPTKFFDEIVPDKQNELIFEKQEANEFEFKVEKPKIKSPQFFKDFANVKNFEWDTSFLRSKSFAVATSFLFLLTMSISFFIQKDASEKIAYELGKSESKILAQKLNQVKVLGEDDGKNETAEEIDTFVLETLKKFEQIKKEDMEEEINKMVDGYPIKKMTPLIAQLDTRVAAFVIAIAKKESNWGKRVPVFEGEDCFNYWGYRGIREKMGTGGHTCFDSPRDAVETVSRRINDLVQAEIDTPQEMVIWKCGSSCAGHSEYSVDKWISDVEMYFEKFNGMEEKSDPNA
jgi:hypothetical protein